MIARSNPASNLLTATAAHLPAFLSTPRATSHPFSSALATSGAPSAAKRKPQSCARGFPPPLTLLVDSIILITHSTVNDDAYDFNVCICLHFRFRGGRIRETRVYRETPVFPSCVSPPAQRSAHTIRLSTQIAGSSETSRPIKMTRESTLRSLPPCKFHRTSLFEAKSLVVHREVFRRTEAALFFLRHVGDRIFSLNRRFSCESETSRYTAWAVHGRGDAIKFRARMFGNWISSSGLVISDSRTVLAHRR